MFSIDQNCHSLWDTIPKLQAIVAAGLSAVHCIEDIDVAFTAMGARPDDAHMELARERFHRSGGQDWGAAMFYSEFLGKLPVEVRDYEPATGMKTATLAKKTDRSVDALYDEFSPGDNWQLIGSSYIHDEDHHRVIGDLSVGESAPFLRELLDKARKDLLNRFPGPDARSRIDQWFQAETARIYQLIDRCQGGRLVDLYDQWMRLYLGDSVTIRLTSDMFSTASARVDRPLLDLFCRDYATASKLYNQAIEETGVGLRPLKRSAGELPFFAAHKYHGHLVRTAMHLQDGALRVGCHSVHVYPEVERTVHALAELGVLAVAGKALLLVSQVRLGKSGRPLALPHMGSLYMPAAHRLAKLLEAGDLLPGPLAPIVRVRLHLLDRMRGIDTEINLPDHLAEAMNSPVVTADELGNNWRDIQDRAQKRLEDLKDDDKRKAWQEQNLPELTGQAEQLEARRIEIVKDNPKDPRARRLWAEQKQLQTRILDQTLRQIARDTQTAQMEYWDSRGAILPWCIALQGPELYDRVIREARLSEETA